MHTALTLMLANGCHVRFAEVVSFMQEWWFTPDLETNGRGGRIREATSVRWHVAPAVATRARTGSGRGKNSRKLDPRTKETHRGTLSITRYAPSSHLSRMRSFAPKPVEFRPRSVLDGKILVVSLDAVSHPDLARLIFRIVRQDFYAAVRSPKGRAARSRPALRSHHRRVGVVCHAG